MPLRLAHPFRLLVLVAAIALLLVVVGALAAGRSRPHSLSIRAGKPTAVATVSVGPHPVAAVIALRPYRVMLRITPNGARAHDHVSVTISARGRPVDATRVTVLYGMAAMDMPDVYSGQLGRTNTGTYAATEPVLGMPGTWKLRFSITTGKKPPVMVTVTDQMSAY